MMLTDPELVVLQFVEPFRQFQVALQLQRGMLADRMMGREKHPEAETIVHCVTPSRSKITNAGLDSRSLGLSARQDGSLRRIEIFVEARDMAIFDRPDKARG